MSVGANIYIQIPDSSSHEDIQTWKAKFVAHFGFYEGMDQDYTDWYVFNIAGCGLPDVPYQGKHLSAWEVFPDSIFLEVHTMIDYYFPGYRRGSIEKLTEVGQWIETNVPSSIVWYGASGTGVATPFTQEVRKLFLEYFHLTDDETQNGDIDHQVTQNQWIHKIGKQQRESIETIKFEAMNK